mmetsp:Transcript_10342/g.24297  ORF Transcript_10342/g.24297 Transcript_10342/m.24297 type:complete len:458 (+) Transcript_10342:98-1471(+)
MTVLSCSGSDHVSTTLTSLPGGVLSLFWPADRVLLGIRSCKWLREQLMSVPCIVLHAKKAEHSKIPEASDVHEDISRFCICGMKIALKAVATEYESATYFRKHCFFGAIFRGLARVLAEGASSSLEQLDFTLHPMGNFYARLLACSLQECPQLTSLSLSGVGLTCDGLDSLVSALGTTRVLTHLDVSRNDLAKQGVQTLSRLLQLLPQLVHLDLSHTTVCKREAGSLTCQLPVGLSFLDMSFCRMKVAGGLQLARMLGQRTALTSLRVSGNDFGQAAAAAVVRELRHHTQLQLLDLSRNSIGESGARELGMVLLELPAVTHLNLSMNGLGLQAGPRLLPHLGWKTAGALAHLDLSYTSIQTDGAVTLASVLQGSSELKTLDLSACSIFLTVRQPGCFGPGLQAMIDLLSSCRKLHFLSLEHNHVLEQAVVELRNVAEHPSREAPALLALTTRHRECE